MANKDSTLALFLSVLLGVFGLSGFIASLAMQNSLRGMKDDLQTLKDVDYVYAYASHSAAMEGTSSAGRRLGESGDSCGGSTQGIIDGLVHMCFCDVMCLGFNDCCSDVFDACPGVYPPNTTAKGDYGVFPGCVPSSGVYYGYSYSGSSASSSVTNSSESSSESINYCRADAGSCAKPRVSFGLGALGSAPDSPPTPDSSSGDP